MALLAAVGGDTYGGLSGYKRPLQGIPTRVPNSLPASNKAPNNPGAPIKTPAIKSSAARPNRGSNVTIPYARVCPLAELADIYAGKGLDDFCKLPDAVECNLTRAEVAALRLYTGPMYAKYNSVLRGLPPKLDQQSEPEVAER